MQQLTALLSSIPTTFRPLVGGLLGCMVIVAGLMILTAGRSSGQVAGGILTIRNAIGGVIVVGIGAALIASILAGGGIAIPGATP